MAIKTKTASAFSIDTDDIEVIVKRENGQVVIRCQAWATNADGDRRFIEITEVAAAALRTEIAKVVNRMLSGWV